MTARTVRRVNLALAVAWLVMVPVSILTGWLWSVAFISAASIYANAATHLSAARADTPTEGED